MIAISYLMKRKIKKNFLDIISNTKILFNKIANDLDFAKLTGDWTTSNTVIQVRLNFLETVPEPQIEGSCIRGC